MCGKENFEGKLEESVTPFILEKDIRGKFVRIETSLNQILAQHNYPDHVSRLLAEALLLTVMIGQAIKLRWKLSLQIRGNNALKLIATDFFAPDIHDGIAKIRGFAKFDMDKLSAEESSITKLFGKGYFAVLIDQGEGTEPYQGITSLSGKSLSENAITYFLQSEQIPTAFKIIVERKIASSGDSEWYGKGMMLQDLGTFHEKNKNEENHSDFLTSGENKLLETWSNKKHGLWSRAKFLLSAIDKEFLEGGNRDQSKFLEKLFRNEELEVLPSTNVSFGCSCSEYKVVSTLSIYSKKDINSMTDEFGHVTADCQFCGKHYVLDPNTLGFERNKNKI